MKPTNAPCDTTYRAAHDSGFRRTSRIRYVVIHCTQGSSARGAAEWFTSPNSSGSANLVVDDADCFRCVPDDVTPWAAPPRNEDGFHIEIAGYVSRSRTDWLRHEPSLKRAAYKTALRCKWYGVPVRQVGWLGLRLGRKGITSHNAVSKAWRQSDHTDPGPHFPWPEFMKFVRAYSVQV